MIYLRVGIEMIMFVMMKNAINENKWCKDSNYITMLIHAQNHRNVIAQFHGKMSRTR